MQILFINYSGFIAGDDAMFEVLQNMVSRNNHTTLTLKALTAMPERTLKRYPQISEAEHIYDYLNSASSRSRVYEMVAQSDFIIVGGGDIIEGQRPLLIIGLLSMLAGTPIIYIGVGVLLPHNTLKKVILGWVMRNGQLIATRDAVSSSLLNSIKVQNIIIPDLASALEVLENPTTAQLLAHDRIKLSKPYIIINLRRPDTNQYAASWDEVEYEAIAEVCRTLIDIDNFLIICVPMITEIAQPPENEPSDELLLVEFASRVGRPGQIYVLAQDLRPAELATIMAGARLACGMRLHFLVLSAIGGVPLVALSYAKKVSEFMRSTGQTEFCLDIENLQTQTLLHLIYQSLAQSMQINKKLLKWRQDSQMQLNNLSSVFTSINPKQSKIRFIRQVIAPLLVQFGYKVGSVFRLL